ncbi:hypothetical protein [Pelagibius sp.]|uniref:hypothetical protein n=1 Tax=Pelagibius sp. TaxID=1931238 RepID=UPI003B50C0E9
MHRTDVEAFLTDGGFQFTFLPDFSSEGLRLESLAGAILVSVPLPKTSQWVKADELTVIEIDNQQTVSTAKCRIVLEGP